MMLHWDGSRREWAPGREWDLIVTLDDATSEVYPAFFVAEEGTISSFWTLRDARSASAGQTTVRGGGLRPAGKEKGPTREAPAQVEGGR